MSLRLDDAARVRALTRACRARADSSAHHRRWRWRRWRADAPARSRVIRQFAPRLCFTCLFALSALWTARQPLAAQLLSLHGLALMEARIKHLRMQLHHDPALAVLAQLPISNPTMFAYQLRPRWRAAIWTAFDALAFWLGVAWVEHAAVERA